MATTSNMETMMRTVEEMTEAQRRSYEALADNFAAFQRRNIEFAQGGLEFSRLQESNARAAREWWASGLELLELQQRNFGFTRDWMSGGIEALRDQTEQNRRTAEAFVRSARQQQEGLRNLAEGWTGAYRSFFSPFDYAQGILRSAGQATQKGLQVTQQATQQGLQLAEGAAEQTEWVVQQTQQVVRQAEEVVKEAETQAAVLNALGTEDYEELSVTDISKKLDALSAENLVKLREYETRNKNRETLVAQIDRKIKTDS